MLFLSFVYFLIVSLTLFFITTITTRDNEALSIFNASILQSQIIAINTDEFVFV